MISRFRLSRQFLATNSCLQFWYACVSSCSMDVVTPWGVGFKLAKSRLSSRRQVEET